jgi:hypothetical protein
MHRIASRPPHLEPEAPPPNGRDAKGRFAKDNPGGPGNPFARRTAAFRKAAAEAVSDETVTAVMHKLAELALAGDLAAIKLFLAYTVGKPAPAVDPDTLDLHEVRHYAHEDGALDDLRQALRSPGLAVLLDMARLIRPARSGQVADQLLDGIAELDALDAARRQEEADESPEEEPSAADAEDESPAAAPLANGGNGRHGNVAKPRKPKRAPSANGANGRRVPPSPVGSPEPETKGRNAARKPPPWKDGTNGHGRARPVRPPSP